MVNEGGILSQQIGTRRSNPLDDKASLRTHALNSSPLIRTGFVSATCHHSRHETAYATVAFMLQEDRRHAV